MLNFNIFGISMIGSDICGFHYNTTKEMCQRWTELGAFYPFARNHNDRDYVDQDPAAFNGQIINSSKVALSARYSLLPYLYSLFYRSHLYGDTVIRALFFEFPNDKIGYSIDEQFLWGPALLVSPVLTESTTLLNVYLPEAIWYDFWTGEQLTSVGVFVPLYTPLEKINVHVRGGYILPMQEPSQTTTASRNNSFWLLAALDENMQAVGELFWDHGDQIDSWEKQEVNIIKFQLKKNQLQSHVDLYKYQTKMILSNVTILGVDRAPKTVTINDKAHSNFDYVAGTMVLYIENLTISLKEVFTLRWN